MTEAVHAFADVNGVRLHYVRRGQGAPVILLHGFPEFWYGWRAQIADLGRDHDVVAPDMRGYNLSSKPAEVEAYRVGCLVADVRALGRHLGFQRFNLVGHDWGGVVAWAYACAHPDDLDSLTIVNAPHPAVFARELARSPEQQRASEYMNLFRNDKAERVMSENGYARLARMFWEERPDLYDEADRAAYLAAWSEPGALTGGLNYYRASNLHPSAAGEAPPVLARDPALLRVRVPTQVIWGERDHFLLTGNLDGLSEYVPDLVVHRVPDATHWIAHEKPELVGGLIRDFVARRARPAPT